MVTPKFQGDDDVSAERKGLFRRDVRLEATAPWLSVGKGVVVTRGGKAFTIRIDPCAAGPEGAGPFCGEVLGYDDAAPGHRRSSACRWRSCGPRPSRATLVLTLPPSFQAGDI